ncbi:MAG: CvpA family protein [Pelagibacteraceae bacterium]|nr:CvpA family protein [Pelagibacteraceae bacterium]
MLETLKVFFVENPIDLLYMAISIFYSIQCYIRGFVLSLLGMAKWVLAYVVTINLFPIAKPYLKDVIDNEYILDIGLNISIFIVTIFVILIVNKLISKAVIYSRLGGLDAMFGFFFGFIKAYIFSLFIFSAIHIVYNYDKWPINLDKSYVFPYLEKGSNYLLKELPNEEIYQDSKEKINNI